jgi:uncharacterized protein (TIGR02466 family)
LTVNEEIRQIFGAFFYRVQIPETQEMYKDALPQMLNNQLKVGQKAPDDWTVHTDYGDYDGIEPIDWKPMYEVYGRYLSQFVSSYFTNIKKNMEIRIDRPWYNVYTKGDRAPSHAHMDCHFACCHYIQYDDSHPPICFENPCKTLADAHGEIPRNKIFKEDGGILSSGMFANWHPVVQQNDLIIFPAWLYHFVMPNPTDIPRVSVAFNIEVC